MIRGIHTDWKPYELAEWYAAFERRISARKEMRPLHSEAAKRGKRNG